MMVPTRRDFLVQAARGAGGISLGFLSPPAAPADAPAAQGEAAYLRLSAAALSERAATLKALYKSCSLCPRDCRVDRTKGEKGKCQASDRVKVSSAFPHFGEEAPLVGQGGSGTVFFCHCGLRCWYCQNHEISFDAQGEEITDRQLAEIFVKVQKIGCHNINFVTPTHFLPSIINAVALAVPLGLRVPLVYNTSGYEKLEILQLLDGIVDIYLPDYKYDSPEPAAKYSSEAYNYPYYARIALKEMHRQVGELAVDGRGVARRGLIIRHLILPNRLAGTKGFLKFVATELSKGTAINLMRQYRPEHKAWDFPELSRVIKTGEYAEAVGWARELGLTRFDL
jgi:putative pyruvate formate lyase activating enzyme